MKFFILLSLSLSSTNLLAQEEPLDIGEFHGIPEILVQTIGDVDFDQLGDLKLLIRCYEESRSTGQGNDLQRYSIDEYKEIYNVGIFTVRKIDDEASKVQSFLGSPTGTKGTGLGYDTRRGTKIDIGIQKIKFYEQKTKSLSIRVARKF